MPGIIHVILIVALYVSCFVWLGVWKNSDFQTILNTSITFLVLLLLLCLNLMWNYMTEKDRETMSYYDLLFLGIPFLLSCVVVAKLVSVKNENEVTQNQVLDDMKNVHLPAAIITIIYLSFCFIRAYYRYRVLREIAISQSLSNKA
jgi:uncharacterized BrkB/YihY/UPF0761 family membrane protein